MIQEYHTVLSTNLYKLCREKIIAISFNSMYAIVIKVVECSCALNFSPIQIQVINLYKSVTFLFMWSDLQKLLNIQCTQ